MTQNTPLIKISVSADDFDQAMLYEQLSELSGVGAVVTFVGLVREFSTQDPSTPMYLEHYPKMTENVLLNIAQNACNYWPLKAATIVHRVGQLDPSSQIVFVGVASAHRQAAFEASQYIIDLLKTRAPFWKKEGKQWVSEKSSDHVAANRWQCDHG